MLFSLPSFAKVNLQLRVLGKREDGFHEVFTILQTISLHDVISFEAAGNGVELTCSDYNIPTDGSNLILKAAELLQGHSKVVRGASIHLDKNIPSPGGLGGGSSNAAVALIELSRLWDLDVELEVLEEIAARIGSDVPFFLYGGTALGTGTGSTVSPIDDIDLDCMILVTPNVNISTVEAYAELTPSPLTTKGTESILSNYRFGAGDALECVNDFEKTVFTRFPGVGAVKQALLDLGAKQASLCGSGASVFGIFDNEETRQTALKALGERTDWRTFAVTAVSRSEYRDKLGI